MEGQATCYVSGALAAVLRVSKYLGAAPLQFVKHGSGWHISRSRRCSFLGYIAMGVCHICAIWIFGRTLLFGPSGGRNVVAMVIVVSMLLSSIVVYLAPRRMRLLITCLNQVEKIHLDLDIQCWPKPWSQKQKALMITWAVVSATVGVMDLILITVFQHRVPLITWFDSMPIMQMILDCIIAGGRAQFCMITLYVQTCFRAVNNCLMTVLRDMEKNEVLDENSPYKAKNSFKRVDLFRSKKIDVDVKPQQCPHETVRRAYSAYARACEVVHLVDQAHGPMLLLLLALFLLHLISKFYNLIISIIDQGFSKDFINFIYFETAQLGWCIYHVINLVIIIEPCNMTYTAMEKTRELVSQLMRYTRSAYAPLTVELEQFCRHLSLNEVTYRPLYVTTMTRGLVLTILGNIITYLVILIDLK